MIVAPGATSISVDVQFLDDTGFALTGKVAADFPACKWSGGSNTADTTITLTDLAAITTAHPNDNTAGGIKEREGGWYRLDLPNNMFTSAGRKTLTFAETTNKRIVSPNFDCQYVQGDARQWLGGTIPAVTQTGVPKVDVAYLLGTAWLTPGTAGTPDVNTKLWNGLTTVALPLIPTTAGRSLDVAATGEAGLDFNNILSTGLATLHSLTITNALTASNASNFLNLGTDAITSGVWAASATTEVQTGLATSAALTTAQADLDDIQTRLPAALTAGGLMKSDALAWNGLTTVELPLVPTTAGRKLDVSAGGEAGLDWANIGTPGSTVNLAATTINLANTTTTLTNLPAITANWLTAAGIADGAIDRATFAADTGLQTLRSNTCRLNGGSTTAVKLDASASSTDDYYNGHTLYLTGGTGAGQSAQITDYSGILQIATVAGFATAPDATTTYAILPLASDASVYNSVAALLPLNFNQVVVDDTGFAINANVTEWGYFNVADGNTYAQASRAAVGLGSANLDTQLSALQSDTDNIQTRLPAALVSGRMDSSVGAMATDVLTSTALAASAVTEIQSGISTITAADVWAAATRTLTALGAGAAADVNAELLDVLATDTYTLPTQGTPPTTPTLAQALVNLYSYARNPITANKDTGVQSYYNAAGSTIVHKRTIADDGTTFSLGGLTTGA